LIDTVEQQFNLLPEFSMEVSHFLPYCGGQPQVE
jgi:hypothetical protein